MSETSFAEKVAIVTGATGGIGRAIVLGLARKGVSVVAADIESRPDGPGADATPNVFGRPCDVRDPGQVADLVAETEARIGPVGYLVNCAGVLRPAAALETTADDWEQTFSVNAAGVFHMSSAVARRMVTRRRGAIVTVASNAAHVPRMRMAAYCASKAAAVAYTKSLGLELAEAGIRCNVVAPGSTDTGMLRSLWHDETGPAGSLDGSLAEYRVGIPLRRFAEPDDIAHAVAFLLSDQARHITMHELLVDGGASLGV